MVIRRAEIKDVPDIISLLRLEHVEHCIEEKTGMAFLPDFTKRRLDLYTSTVGEGIVVVAESGGKLAGITTWKYKTEWDQKILHETSWFVVPEERGAGLGFKLVEFLIEEARKEGLTDTLAMGAIIGNNHEKLMEKSIKLGFIPFQITAFKRLEKPE